MSSENPILQYETPTARPGKGALITGWILSGLLSVLMLSGAVFSFVKPVEAQEGFVKYGYPQQYFFPLIVVQIVCVVLYLIPQTAVLGAILLTGYLGGATATHVRAAEPTFIAPVFVGMIFWFGLFLRDPRIRALIPLRS